MIALILSLMTWEWYKLRRRWMPWIMLAIAIAFSQLIFWAGFAFESAFGQTGETLRLPDVITEGLGFGYQIVAILIIIWAASALGSEYGWGTFRTILVKGPGRWQFLCAQFCLMLAMAFAWMAAVGVAFAVSSVIAGSVMGDGGLLSFAGEWVHLGKMFGKWIYALAPYIVLTMFLVILTSSTGVATAITLGYVFVGEGVLIPFLTARVDGFETVADFVLGRAVDAWLAEGGPNEAEAMLSGLGISADLPSNVHGFLVALVYIAVLGAATVWLFLRKDIGGARGS